MIEEIEQQYTMLRSDLVAHLSGLGRLAGSLLFELQNTDPVVLVAAVSGLALVALGAGAIPA